MRVRRAILGTVVLAGLVCVPHLGVAPVAQLAGDRIAAVAEPTEPDLFGDALPPGVLVRMGSGRLRHGSSVDGVSFTPSGKLVSCGGDGTVRVWDPATGKELLRLDAGKKWVRSLAVSRDGRFLAAGSDAAYVWDADTGKLLHRLSGDTPFTDGVAFSPDGTRLVAGGGDSVFRVWDVTTGQPERSFSAEPVFIPEVAFSPDGKVLVTTHDRIVRLWDAATGEKLRSLPDHNARVYGIAFSPDGTLATGTEDGHIRLWDVPTGTLRRTIEAHKRQVLGLALSPDGTKLASAGGNNHVCLWDAATGREIRRIADVPGSSHGNAYGVAFSPDGATLAVGTNGSRISLWDVVTGREKLAPDGHETYVTRVAFTPDGKGLISGSHDGAVIGWDAATGREQRTYTRDGYGPVVSPDGAVVVAGGRTVVRGWKVATGEPVFESPVGLWTASRLAYLSPGRLLASGSQHESQVLEATTGRRVGDAPRAVLAVAPGGEVVCLEGQSVVVRDPVTRKGTALFSLPVPTPPEQKGTRGETLYPVVYPKCAAVSPDGKTVATASIAYLTNGQVDGPGVVWNPYAEDVQFWDVATGRLVRTIPLPVESWLIRPQLDSLTFSPDGRILAGGNRTGGHGPVRASVYFWGVASGRRVHRITIGGVMGESIAACPAFSPDGRTIATGGPGATALIWQLPPAVTAPE